MKYLSQRHSKPAVAMVASILTAALFVSYLSANSLLKNTKQFLEQVFIPKGEQKTMKTTENMSRIEHIDAGDFEKKVLRSEQPVLVDFYAEWCGPCKALSPVLEEFARETPNVKIVKINVDENYELAARYNIKSIPSLLVFKDSDLAARHMGLADKAGLKRLITQ